MMTENNGKDIVIQGISSHNISNPLQCILEYNLTQYFHMKTALFQDHETNRI